MVERTLAIIKPDAVKAKNVGNILARIEREGFSIVALKLVQLTKQQAGAFYAVHKERSFYGELCEFMVGGPIVPMVLERENAIDHWRKTMGATNSKEAVPGTIRNEFGTDKQANATHGSDAPETAAVEIAFFFPGMERL
jgi:nucleoside-diphosphate kinase